MNPLCIFGHFWTRWPFEDFMRCLRPRCKAQRQATPEEQAQAAVPKEAGVKS